MLEQGLSSRDAGERAAALQDHGPSSQARAVSAMVKALRDKDRDVRYAAVEALRFSDHPKALDGLHRMAKSDRDLRDDPELHALLLKAIGQHGNPKSIPVLSSELLVHPERDVRRAGILAIANIRTRESVEALLGLMRSAGRNRVQANMVALRLGLVALTGADEGVSQDRWTTWWNDNKKGLRVAEAQPPMQEADRRAWDGHWGIRRRMERAPRRHERGTGDPE